METATAPTGVANPTSVGYGGEMPTVYSQPEVATTGTVQDPSEVFNCGFVTGLDGILKIIEMVTDLCVYCTIHNRTQNTTANTNI